MKKPTPLSDALTALLLAEGSRLIRRQPDEQRREFTLDCSRGSVGTGSGSICVTFSIEYAGEPDAQADQLMAREAVDALMAMIGPPKPISMEPEEQEAAKPHMCAGDIGYLHEPRDHWSTCEGQQVLLIGQLPRIGGVDKWAVWNRERGVHEVSVGRYQFTKARERDRVQLQFDYLIANGGASMVCELLDPAKLQEKWAK